MVERTNLHKDDKSELHCMIIAKKKGEDMGEKAKIEKLTKMQESSKYRAQKRAEELERLTKERIEKEKMRGQ